MSTTVLVAEAFPSELWAIGKNPVERVFAHHESKSHDSTIRGHVT
jgi:hypothetical protein